MRDGRTIGFLGLPLTETLSSPVYFFTLIGPLTVSAALGIQLLFVALLVVKPPERNVDELSAWGVLLTHPEWDILFYVGTNVFILLLGIFLVQIWNARLRSAHAEISEPYLIKQTVIQVVLAAGGTALFLFQYSLARARPPFVQELPRLTVPRAAAFALIAAVTLASALAARTGAGKAGRSGVFGYISPEVATGPKGRWSAWDLITPLVIFCSIYVTTSRAVAGRVFMEETLLHWDYFAMGPALAFRQGMALGSEIHSAYGLGWPMVFSALSNWLPLSYGRFIQMASIYSCLYFTGVYLFLRLLVRRPLLAAVGTVLAMLPYFVAMEGLIIWRVPNVTVMRWPFDIWSFIAVVMYTRSQKRIWATVAGALVGLAIVFVIDTGTELTAAFAFFWVCRLLQGPDPGRILRDLAWAAVAALAVLVVGLALAGRGDIFNPEFVRGWLEAPLEFGKGFGMLPVANVAKPSTLAVLSTLIFLYASQAGFTLAKSRHRATGSEGSFELIAGLLAAYGLLVLVKYMGHSAELIIYRLVMPAALLATILLDRAVTHYSGYAGQIFGRSARYRVALGLPMAAAALLAGILVAGPSSTVVDDFLAYPNVVSTQVAGRAPEGLCLIPRPRDLCGLPEAMSEPIAGVKTIIGRLEELKQDGRTFAVIDETGSLFNAATDTAPFGRYSRIFATTPTKRLVRQVQQNMDRSPPDYVLTRTATPPGATPFDSWSNFGYGPVPGDQNLYGETWEAMLDVVHRRYELDGEVGPFQFWRLKDPT